MTRIEELLSTPPAERPRKGPRRWEKSADGSCGVRDRWHFEYRFARRVQPRARLVASHSGIDDEGVDPLSCSLVKSCVYRLWLLREQVQQLKEERTHLP